MKPRKTALFGGSFDPVHNGHISAARAVWEKLGADRVVLVPNYQNPLKEQAARASAEERLEMLRLAVAGMEGLEVSRIETERGAPSHTAQTLRLWRRREGNGSLWFVMGRDLFSSVAEWRDFEEIFEKTNIAVISRRGVSAEAAPPFEIKDCFLYDGEGMETVRFNHKSGSRLWFVKIDAPDISSTLVRNRVRDGGGFERLVPSAVADFIRQNKLYTGDPRK